MSISFDFWSPEGVAFLSFYNRSSDTVLLNLSASEVSTDRKQIRLAELLGMERRRADFVRDYPNFKLVKRGEAILAVLVPDEWTGFEAYAQTAARVRGTRNSGTKQGQIRHRLSYDFSLETGDTSYSVLQRVEATRVDILYDKQLDAFEQANETAGYYFRDRHEDRDVILLGALDALSAY